MRVCGMPGWGWWTCHNNTKSLARQQHMKTHTANTPREQQQQEAVRAGIGESASRSKELFSHAATIIPAQGKTGVRVGLPSCPSPSPSPSPSRLHKWCHHEGAAAGGASPRPAAPQHQHARRGSGDHAHVFTVRPAGRGADGVCIHGALASQCVQRRPACRVRASTHRTTHKAPSPAAHAHASRCDKPHNWK